MSSVVCVCVCAPPQELEIIRKKPENKRCASCAAQERVGFRTIIVKFDLFVCSDCNAAHQAFSHRAKSINMSTFTDEEVDRLKATSNDAKAAEWLGTLTREEVCAQAPTKADK